MQHNYIILMLLLATLTLQGQSLKQGEIEETWWQRVGEKAYSKQVRSDSMFRDNPAARQEFEILQTRDPSTGKVPDRIRERELEFQRDQLRSGTLQRAATVGTSTKMGTDWTSRGPYNIGGRTRALAVDVSDQNTILAGAISGGIWRSTDLGASWNKTTRPTDLPGVTGLAQDTRLGKTNIWYYCTGELIGNTAVLNGDGVYKSVDGGLSWSILAGTSTEKPEAADHDFDFNHKIVVDPTNGDVYVANVGGIYRSKDEGASFDLVLERGSATVWTDVVVSDDGQVFAVVDDRGFFKYDQLADEWEDITPEDGGAFTWYGSDRKVLELSPADPGKLYILADKLSPVTTEGLLFIYDYEVGEWEDRSDAIPLADPTGLTSGHYTQGGYDMVLKVSPYNPDIILLGGVNLYVSTDGFVSTNNTRWIGGYDASDNSYDRYLNHHPDQHALIFLDETKVLSANDGGIQLTEDVTATHSQFNPVIWASLNSGYLSSQVYGLSGGPENMVLAGFQDNGTWFSNDTRSNANWIFEAGGDGGHNAFSSDGRTRFVSWQFGTVWKLKYRNPTDTQPYEIIRVQPATYLAHLFIAPFYLDPKNDDVLYLAGDKKLFVNTDVVENGNERIGWKTIELGDSENTITAIGTSMSGQKVYAGTLNGKLFEIVNPDESAIVRELTPDNFPFAYISSIRTNPNRADEMLLTFANYSVPSVFYSTDGGLTWSDVSGNLEENPDGSGSGPSVRTSAIIPTGVGEATYFVGTSTGLYSTNTMNGSGTTWSLEGSDIIENAIVVDMVNQRDGTTLVGTHGNGIFTSDIQPHIPATDLAIREIPIPRSPIINDSEEVEAIVVNRGIETHRRFTLTLEVDGNEIVTDQIEWRLDPGEDYTHTFSMPFDGFDNPGEYLVQVTVDIDGDEILENNSLVRRKVKAEYITEFPHTEDFEGIDHGWLGAGVWQLGEPNQKTLESAHSGTNAWMTSLASDVENNTISTLISPVFDFSSLQIPIATFFLNYQIASDYNLAMNGAHMLYRTSATETFEPIPIEAGLTGFYNYAGVLSLDRKPGWSGSTAGEYQQTKLLLDFLAGEEFVQFAFTHETRSFGLPDEGIALDDFSVYEKPQNDLAAMELLLPDVLGRSSQVTVGILNEGQTLLDEYELAYYVNDVQAERITMDVPIEPGSGIYHTFSVPYDFSARTSFDVKVEVSSPTDENDTNNVIESKVTNELVGYYYLQQLGRTTEGLSSEVGDGYLFSGSGSSNIFLDAPTAEKRSFEVPYLAHAQLTSNDLNKFYLNLNHGEVSFEPGQQTSYSCREPVELGAAQNPGTYSDDSQLTLSLAEDTGGSCFRGGIVEVFFQMTRHTSIPDVNTQDSLALLALYHSTDGANWTESWDLETQVFYWNGVTVSPEGRVVDLSLPVNNLKGEIPVEIVDLTALISLKLDANLLTGSIPSSIGQLQALEFLDLSYNQFSGGLPSQLGDISTLRTLRIRFGQLSGSVPENLGNATELVHIDLINNELEGEIPASLGDLNNLTFIDISNNDLSALPDLSHMERVTLFNVSGNKLTFDDIIPNLAVLTDFRYQDNLGMDILDVSAGSDVSLQTNAMEGIAIAYQWYQEEVMIEGANGSNYEFVYEAGAEGYYYCDLTHPEVDPDDLTLMKTFLVVNREVAASENPDYETLRTLYNSAGGSKWYNDTGWLSNRPLSEWHGVVTNEAGRVEELRLENNNLTGSIPSEIGDLDQLAVLNLNSNNLEGPIPNEIGRLSNLENLNISYNFLTGELPTELFDLINLIEIYLGANRLSGEIDEEISALSELKLLSAPFNNFSGSINPVTRLSDLQVLDLHGNDLTGTIPSSINELEFLTWARLSRNQFSGEIPPEFGSMRHLRYLMLGENQLTGEIPVELGDLSQLEFLGLPNNRLSGEIPSQIGNLTNLRRLGLRGNQLSGIVPQSLENLVLLTNLNLHQNQFEDLPDLSMLNINATFDLFQSFKVEGNRLGFADLVPNAAVISSYGPQGKIDEPYVVEVVEGGTYTIEVSEESPQTRYQWYHNDSRILGGTDRTLSISRLNPESHTGTYYCVLNHPAVPHIELLRESIEIEFVENRAPSEISMTNKEILEGMPAGTKVGSILTSDPDAGDLFSYSLSGPDASDFRIDGESGDELLSTTVFDYHAKSRYNITVTSEDLAGHTITENFEISIGPVLGLEDSRSRQITFYPNPVSKMLVVSLPHAIDFETSWRLLSSDGRTAKEGFFGASSEALIDVSDLDAGLYIVQLESQGTYVSAKIIIE